MNSPPGWRHCSAGPGRGLRAEVYDDGLLLVRVTAREVSVSGTPVSLTPTEFRLLAALIRHPGQTLSPDQLLKLAWNDPLGVGPDRVKFASCGCAASSARAPGSRARPSRRSAGSDIGTFLPLDPDCPDQAD